ncbi:hypothetical protein OAJ70_04280 [Pelagibacteraceae bacterium]|nr:hypothetical protein [Pelagibacteraceae bacterium]
MIESKVISKILKKNIIHNYNYLTNKKFNVIVKIHMNKKKEFQKKNYISFVNVKNINNDLRNYFKIIIEEKLTPLSNKFERKFV